ncbi:MAG: 16S rRNA (cytosine(1402)-N(4))-methyltransferase RsmH [Coriobacteriia bacterium]|nr:16S rRNA (cytosine(1402)-N(4))-methyltransferase RsmH [Coriobacteriia bacterium]
MTGEYWHIPVMLEESRSALDLDAGQVFCDCTLGGAGHALAIAQDIAPGGLLIGIDQDDSSIAQAHLRVSQTQLQIHYEILKGNFRHLDELLTGARIPGIDGILFDLGVSSPQIDQPSRGFSYAQDAPLDMRMDPGKQTITAAEIINTLNANDLTRILRTYGEEQWASRIAALVVRSRQVQAITTTQQFAELIKEAIPASQRRTGGNPAKRSFQALRIAVNEELSALKEGIDSAIRWLNPGGRIVVISYHSLEDRIVKQAFAEAARSCLCPAEQPVCTCNHQPILTHISKKALEPSCEERAVNPRSKSAKLRFATKAKEGKEL